MKQIIIFCLAVIFTVAACNTKEDNMKRVTKGIDSTAVKDNTKTEDVIIIDTSAAVNDTAMIKAIN